MHGRPAANRGAARGRDQIEQARGADGIACPGGVERRKRLQDATGSRPGTLMPQDPARKRLQCADMILLQFLMTCDYL